jgi:2-alkenal reductase
VRFPVALVALVAAVLGAAAALAVGRGTGWLGTTTHATYVVREAPSAPAAVRAVPRPLTGGFAPAEIYARRAEGVVTVFAFTGATGKHYTGASQGSGFVVSPDGAILTNAHVVTSAGEAASGADVKAAAEVVVEFADGDRVPARVVGWDVFDDVAVLKVDPKQHALAPVPLGDSSRVVVGEPVAAIGSPFGNTDSLTVGVVSATRSIASLTSRYDIADAIQTDASINHGNSGGPLFDARGRVIGINAQIRGGGSTVGVGFAVPINAAKRSLRQLLAHGRVAYAYLGVGTDDLTPGLARRYGYGVLRGALVTSVQSGSAGARAGLRAGDRTVSYEGRDVTIGGDVVTAIDGRPVRSAADLVQIVTGRLRPHTTARVTIVRDGTRRTVAVRLDERPLR